MKKFAISPVTNDYFTKGKKYPILEEKLETFMIKNDKGQIAICIKDKKSIHLGGKIWKLT